MSAKTLKESATFTVQAILRSRLLEARRCVRVNPDGLCISYRREVVRLWRVALLAVERDAR